ncbi:nucleolar protein 10 [Amborella trichopoda]|uniref:Uncharacterized protein n=1 Tax=Amborella trichopoda TaxID=13333 RepID=U5DD37_AMBTC|nr:nucleolar protein 10 [Amborella trichopoda]ERN19337.1 hypothetical protein AMTR_s00069p00095730 [Amborella trichopoda]|eukprot:XP_006857870.1 nucleolar protein 10 [Amborella trichopoda]
MANQGGSIKVSSINGVKTYSVSGQRSLATWLPPKKLKALRKDKEYMRRVDLIQDLRFETATSKIKATPDGEYLIASGTYPPQIKVYELRELSLKFERHLVSEVIDFQVLGDDYSKLAFLCGDRSVCLHAKYGSHYSLRIPRMGRSMAYDRWSCDLLCAASSPDLYRINLEQGCFLAPLSTRSSAINVVTRSNVHGLVACGCEDGALECLDLRAKSSIGRINAVAPSGDTNEEITALQFDDTGGFHIAVGSSSGKVLIYDLRSSHPLRVKDHMYGSPIVDIKWHQTLNSMQPKMITADKHVVRVWDPESGDGLTSIEPTGGTINNVCVFHGSGLMLMALDCNQIPAYFIPSLGPAPKWCSYLENLTEELEEGAQTTIYDDFKFLTKEDLERLNLTHLIGTNLLRAYMHGFFIDYRLYKKAQACTDPFAYDAYRQQRIQEKMEAERAARVTMKRKLPKVNKKLAARLLEDAEDAELNIDGDTAAKKKSAKKKKGLANEILQDKRFSVLFENKEFEVDEFSPEYLAQHRSSLKKQPSLIDEHFEPVENDDEDEEINGSDASTANHSLEDEPEGETYRRKAKRVPRLYEVKDERHAEAFWSGVSFSKEDALPLEERVAALEKASKQGEIRRGPGGSREISFISKSLPKGPKYEDDDDMRENRRGIESLGFRPAKPHSRGNGRTRGGRRKEGSHMRSRGRGRKY